MKLKNETRLYRLVWGFARTGSQVGVLGEFATEAEATEAAERWDAENDNAAAACWIKYPGDSP